jgi:ParB-like chromosome segregation protein Spo0J
MTDRPADRRIIESLTVQIPLREIEGFQVNEGTDFAEEVKGLVESYRRGEKIPPVVLEYDREEGDFIIIDGFHRVTALRLLGRKTIPAIVTGESSQ